MTHAAPRFRLRRPLLATFFGAVLSSAVGLGGSVGGSAWAAAVISPFAADLAASAYTADSTWPGGSAQAAFNGGHWNSGGYGVHWIQADLGSLRTLGEVRLTIDVLPDTITWQKVYLSDSAIGGQYASFTEVAGRNGFTVGGQQFVLDFTPATGRYLEIVSYGGASWTALGDGGARVDWVDATAQPQAKASHQAPEPGGVALVFAALAGALLLRRQFNGIPVVAGIAGASGD